MANAIRGERDLKLPKIGTIKEIEIDLGNKYTLKCSGEAQELIERHFGMSLLAVMASMCAPSPGLVTSTNIIYYFINAGCGRKEIISFKDLSDELYKIPAHKYGRFVLESITNTLKPDAGTEEFCYLTMRPTVGAAMAIEGAIGLGLPQIRHGLCTEANVPLYVASNVIYHSVKAHPNHSNDSSITYQKIRDYLHLLGFQDYTEITLDCLDIFINGDDSVPVSSEDEKKQ